MGIVTILMAAGTSNAATIPQQAAMGSVNMTDQCSSVALRQADDGSTISWASWTPAYAQQTLIYDSTSIASGTIDYIILTSSSMTAWQDGYMASLGEMTTGDAHGGRFSGAAQMDGKYYAMKSQAARHIKPYYPRVC